MTERRIRVSEIRKQIGVTQKEKLDKLTDEEIAAAALDDPDSALPTDEELKGFRPARKKLDNS